MTHPAAKATPQDKHESAFSYITNSLRDSLIHGIPISILFFTSLLLTRYLKNPSGFTLPNNMEELLLLCISFGFLTGTIITSIKMLSTLDKKTLTTAETRKESTPKTKQITRPQPSPAAMLDLHRTPSPSNSPASSASSSQSPKETKEDLFSICARADSTAFKAYFTSNLGGNKALLQEAMTKHYDENKFTPLQLACMAQNNGKLLHTIKLHLTCWSLHEKKAGDTPLEILIKAGGNENLICQLIESQANHFDWKDEPSRETLQRKLMASNEKIKSRILEHALPQKSKEEPEETRRMSFSP